MQRVNSKASELISKNFTVSDEKLLLDGIDLHALASEHKKPLFLYSSRIILANIAKLRTHLPSFQIFYSVKANPNQSVISTVLKAIDGLEVASVGELNRALRAGCTASGILFAGPGKGDQELKIAVESGIGEIHIESLNELDRLSAITQQNKTSQAISIRVNLSAQAQGGAMQMGGKPTAFGIDEEQIDEAIPRILQSKGVRLVGFHFYTGTQILDAETLANTYQHAAQLAIRLTRKYSLSLESLDFGGGFGVPYFESESELNLEKAGSLIEPIAIHLKSTPGLEHCKLIIEPGRFIVAEAGVYIAQVIDVKRSRGVTFSILNGGMNHHLAASGNLGQVIKRNFPMLCANKPENEKTIETEVVGPLCTPLDTLGRKVQLPLLEVGDTVCILQSGAYAKSASPSAFLSHPEALEFIIEAGQTIPC